MYITKSSLFALIATSFLMFQGCKTEPSSNNATINIRLKKDPERINPLVFPNPTAREIYQYIHVALADYDPETLDLMPILITEIPTAMSIDTGLYKGGVAFDLTFRPDATWENGSPITAEDYLFTIKSINMPLTNAGRYREYTERIKDIIIDPKDNKKCRVILGKTDILALEIVVKIELYPRYFYDTENALAAYKLSDFNVDNEEKIKEDSTLVRFADAYNGNEYSRNKISGAGPYKFVSWTSDQTVILEKKQNYWGKDKGIADLAQEPEKIIFSIIPDDVTALAQLKAGNIDVMNEVGSEMFLTLKNDPQGKEDFEFFTPALTKYYIINMNNSNPKFSDKLVRKAFAHLVDVPQLIEVLESGLATRINGPVHPIKKSYLKTLPSKDYNIEKAAKLLADAGWKDSDNDGVLDKTINGSKVSMNLEILISGQETGKKLALYLKENAEKVGIKIDIVEKEFKIIRAEHLKTRNYDLIPSIVSNDIVKWDELSSKWHSDSDNPAGANDFAYHNPALDAVLDEINVTKDESKLFELYHQAQMIINEDQPGIFLYAPLEKIIVSKAWNGSSTARRPGYMANTFVYTGQKIKTQSPSSN